MANTLGKLIGIIAHSFNITNNAGDKASLKVYFDCTTASDDEIRSWIASDRCIALARPSRGLDINTIKSLDGTTIMATKAGHKPKSPKERIEDLVASGMDEQMATIMVNDPVLFDKMMATAKASMDDTTVDSDNE